MKTVVNLNEQQLEYIEKLLRDTREYFSAALCELGQSDLKKDHRKFAAHWATLAELTVRCRIANRGQKTVAFVPEKKLEHIFPAIEICTAEDILKGDTDMVTYYKGLGLTLLTTMRYGTIDDDYLRGHSGEPVRMPFVHFFVIPEGQGLCVTNVPLYKGKEVNHDNS